MGETAAAYWSDAQWYKTYTKILPGMYNALNEPNKYCVDPKCPDTNWSGYGRTHIRGELCPQWTASSQDLLKSRIRNTEAFIHNQNLIIQDSAVSANKYADKILEALNA